MKYINENGNFKPSNVKLGETVEFEIKVLNIEKDLQLNPSYPTTNRITLDLLKPEKYSNATWLYRGKLLKKMKAGKKLTFKVMRFGKDTKDIRYI